MKYNDNGTYKDIYVKTFDTLPIGAIVEYSGSTIPSGWTEISDPTEYSATEKIVGTWTNGKPIYRKVIVYTKGVDFTSNNTTILHGISNIDEIVNYNVLSKTIDNLYRLIPWTYYTTSSTSSWYSGIAVNATNFKLEIGTTLYEVLNNIRIIIEYTKTTD